MALYENVNEGVSKLVPRFAPPNKSLKQLSKKGKNFIFPFLESCLNILLVGSKGRRSFETTSFIFTHSFAWNKITELLPFYTTP